ncbi:unnamed protein product, partial [Phaeothamnion confervicola]
VEEDRSGGGADWAVFADYFRECGYRAVAAALVVALLAQLVSVLKEVVLARWSDAPSSASTHAYLTAYALFCLGTAVGLCLRFVAVCHMGLVGSERLHRRLLDSVLGAPMAFFQRTSGGRIVSRFASDMDSVDLVIPTMLASSADAVLSMLAAVCVVVVAAPGAALLVGPVALAYHRVQGYYRVTSRELKRVDGATKTPVLSHLQQTLDGLASGYRIERHMTSRAFFFIDANTRARVCWDAVNRWLGIRLDALGAAVVLGAALHAVWASRRGGHGFAGGFVDGAGVGASSAGTVGLGLSYALTITRVLGFGVRSSTALENVFNSVERIGELVRLPPESDCRGGSGGGSGAAGGPVGPDWPARRVEFADAVLRHRENLPPAVRGVAFGVAAGEVVGLCGRTGCGKSTLALALVRMVECIGGGVLGDGIDVRDVSLEVLRSRITLVPQDSVMLSGTVREALDPFERRADAYIWELLSDLGLKAAVADTGRGLDAPVAAGGSNWSAGQRQLFGIARALCCAPRVLVLDESTASVDSKAAAAVRRTIRARCCSGGSGGGGGGIIVLVVAHRVADMAGCDRVVVMDAGAVVEAGTPQQLLTLPGGAFRALVEGAGPQE